MGGLIPYGGLFLVIIVESYYTMLTDSRMSLSKSGFADFRFCQSGGQ